MPTNRLYDTWRRRKMELRPGQRITQVHNFVWLIVGIFRSGSVYLSRIAGKIPSPAKLLSATRRLSRLLDNPAIRVRDWDEPIARGWLETQLQNLGAIRLIVDGTKIGFAGIQSWESFLDGNSSRKHNSSINGACHDSTHTRLSKQTRCNLASLYGSPGDKDDFQIFLCIVTECPASVGLSLVNRDSGRGKSI